MRCAWRQVLLPQGVSHIPSCAMSLGLPEGQASGERNEGLPARVEQKREHRSVSGGRSDFAQLVICEPVD